MTDQPWDIPIPELDADGQPVTPEVQDAVAELTPELLATLTDLGCVCSPDVGWLTGRDPVQAVVYHDDCCPFGRPDPATN
jgi:hypothetical protein